jgi:hypothetical protein
MSPASASSLAQFQPQTDARDLLRVLPSRQAVARSPEPEPPFLRSTPEHVGVKVAPGFAPINMRP